MEVEQYQIQIPRMLRQTFKAFSSDNRSTIIEALFNNNKPLTFSEIKKLVNLDQRVLTDELRTLMSGAVIDHYTDYQYGIKQHSYYEITEYGSNILKATIKVLYESYEPTIKSKANMVSPTDASGNTPIIGDVFLNSADSPCNSPSNICGLNTIQMGAV